MPGQYEDTPAPTDPDSTAPPRRRIGMWVVAALAGALVIAAIIAGLMQRSSTPDQGQAPPPGGDHPGEHASLPRGDVRIGASAAGDDVYDVPVGFPAGRDGGVAAAVNWATHFTHESALVDEQREAVQDAVFAKDFQGQRPDAAAAAQMRRELGLNEGGQPMTSGGQVDLDARPVAHCDGRLGAYRVTDATEQRADVQVWMPCLFGMARNNDAAGLELVWTQANASVTREGGDWQLASFQPETQPPQPARADRPAVSLAERAQLFDAEQGWVVPANAVEHGGLEG